MNLLSLENITKAYTERVLLDGASFFLQEGEKVGIIGINGTGKSTLLKLAAGLEEPDTGSYTKANHVVIRYLPQTPEFDDSCTVWEHVEKKISESTQWDMEGEAKSMLRTLGIVLLEQKISELSGGQRKRLALAEILMQPCDILVLDEPTSFLDVRYKLELLAILERMARKKHITVIMSLHEIDLAQKVSDKIICVKGDTIAHYGKPEEVFKENTIRSLYEIDNGSFDPVFGSIELPKIEGEPEVFVISSGGSGIPIYRQLQKEHIPFAAGILYKNDIDYQLARLLAVEVITEEPFRQISDETFARAVEVMKKCKRVIVTDVPVGECNKRVEELIKLAK